VDRNGDMRESGVRHGFLVRLPSAPAAQLRRAEPSSALPVRRCSIIATPGTVARHAK
jgi:hypothetical protein